MTIEDGHLPLSALLSQPLVAFIVEFDNEFEHRSPHRTTDFGGTPGTPWLVSMGMWTKFLRHVPLDGITVGELQKRTQSGEKELPGWLIRLSKWWRYLRIEGAGASPKRLPPGAIVLPTRGGRNAMEVWTSLGAVMEARWESRLGVDKIAALRSALHAVAAQLDPAIPDSLPILGYGLWSTDACTRNPECPADLSLPGLLSKVLLAFALEYEKESTVSLAIAANVLRLIGPAGIRLRDLPRLSGVSKEAIAMAQSFLEKQGFATVGPESSTSRVKVLTLTAQGQAAQAQYAGLTARMEERWRTRFGTVAVAELRRVLEGLLDGSGGPSLLLSGAKPYPGCWRASIPAAETLPHFPMLLHRGAFPDGS